VVVGCIDEDKLQAQAFTRERKLEIAQRSYKLLTEITGWGRRTLFSILWFSLRRAMRIISAARSRRWKDPLIKQALPDVRTILGIRCFLRAAGGGAGSREFGFPDYCTKAGLDLAIVNTESWTGLRQFQRKSENSRKTFCFRIPRRMCLPRIRMPGCCEMFPPTGRKQSKEQRAAVNQHYIAAIAEHFRTTKKKEKLARQTCLDERLAN